MSSTLHDLFFYENKINRSFSENSNDKNTFKHSILGPNIRTFTYIPSIYGSLPRGLIENRLAGLIEMAFAGDDGPILLVVDMERFCRWF